MRARGSRASRLVAALAVAVGLTVVVSAQSAPLFKVAFWNIRSGKGSQPLRGHRAFFADVNTCTGSSLNAWGVGFVQRELAASIRNDPAVVVIGLAEAWTCASPENVRKVLEWKARSEQRGGIGVVAKYGFAGEQVWHQLDTSKNRNPRDDMWVMRVPVCLDEACRRSLDVYVSHWSGTGPEGTATHDAQAQDTVSFMTATKGPHVLLGDLNVFEGRRSVCNQSPRNTPLTFLRRAGYVDAWLAANGRPAEGYTGMLNRDGCGTPEGSVWKRIDYIWSKGLTPMSAARFGVVSPGDAAPSDHLGIIAGYRQP